MSNPQKAKGARYENTIRKTVEAAGFPGAVRNTQYDQRQKGAADVFVPAPAAGGKHLSIHVECKDDKRMPSKRVLSALEDAALQQAERARDEYGDGIAFAVFHPYGTKSDDPEKQVAAIRLATLLRLLSAERELELKAIRDAELMGWRDP